MPGVSLGAPALLLALAALVTTGLVPGPGPLAAPAVHRVLAGGAILLSALLAAVRPGPARPVAVLTTVLALAPFLALGILEDPAAGPVPSPGFLALLALAVVIATLPVPAAGRVAGWTVALLGVLAVMERAGARALPPGWNPVSASARPQGSEPSAPPRRIVGPRIGAPVPAGELLPTTAFGPGPWFERATVASRIAVGPLALVLDGRAAPALEERGGVGFARDAEALRSDPLLLDAYDAVVLLPGGWERAGAEARAAAERLATFVRRGGILVGPAPGRAWPEGVARALGEAGRVDTAGADGALPLGLGWVSRAGSEAEVVSLLASRALGPRVRTAFDGPLPVPAPPAELSTWQDEPAPRRRQGLLLFAYAVALAFLDAALRGGWRRRLGLLAPAGAALLGLAWTSPADPGYRLHALRLDLGGSGGRRVEALLVRAGPAGARGQVRWNGGGIVGVRGGEERADGSVGVEPGGFAWFVRESLSSGVPDPSDRESPRAGFLRGLIEGEVPPAALRFGRGAGLPLEWDGRAPPAAWTLRLHR